MEEIVKHINDTNASFRKLGAGNANNTDLFLDNEHFDFFKDAGEKITVRFNKENLAKAILFIASLLPRKYDNPPTHSTIPFSVDFVYDQLAILDAFFVVDGQKAETRTQTWNVRKDVPKKNGVVDNRFYFNGLLEEVSYTNFQKETLKAKFTIRNYLAGGYSDLHFQKSEDNIYDVWVTNTLEPYNTERITDILNVQETLLIEAKQLTTFVLSTVKYFDSIDKLKALIPYANTDSPVKISKDGVFSLVGMFLESTIEEVKQRNEKVSRWFENKFTLGDRVVYLSKMWNGSGEYQLTLSDFIKMIQTCYGKNYVYKLGPNGEHQLWKSKFPLQQIYYGTPGSGKSHKVKDKVEAAYPDKDEREKYVFRTTFHPDSDYASFVGCYKPQMKDGAITYEFVPQAFTKAYEQAWNESEKQIYLIVEEINRGNCAQIFGDLFQLLDRKNGVSEYPIDADDDLRQYLEKELNEAGKAGIANGKIKLPANLNILATMNTSDQSLFPMDSAFKRRWNWECVPIDYNNPDSSAFTISLGEKEYNWHEFLKKVNELIRKATDSEDKQMGNFFIDGDVDESQFVNKVMFYLWNDVCKEEFGTKNNFFRYYVDSNGTEKEFSFNDLFGTDAHNILVKFMVHIGFKDDGEQQNNKESESDGE